MKKYIYTILLISIGIFYGARLHSQVKIGDTTPPAGFSTLEVEAIFKKGGLRIPQLTQNECNALKDHLLTSGKAQEAIGLVIYNTEFAADGGMVLYWNGTDWAKSEALSLLKGENGVTELDSKSGGLKLGGSLKDDAPTEINLNGKDINFSFSGNNAAFKVVSPGGENSLIIKDGKVGIGGSTEPNKALEINNTDPNLPSLRIEAGKLESDYLLISDDNGYASWQPAMALSSIVKGQVMVGAEFGAGYSRTFWDPTLNGYVTKTANGGTDCQITQDPLLLTAGKWLIVGKFTSKTTSDLTSGNPMNTLLAYMSLRRSLAKDPVPMVQVEEKKNYEEIPLVITGALPSAKADGRINNKDGFTAMPQVFYFADVKEDQYFFLMANSSGRHTIVSDYGNYFFALRIDGEQIGVGTEGTVDCSSLSSVYLQLETYQDIVNGPIHPVKFNLNKGYLKLTEGQVIGSKMIYN